MDSHLDRLTATTVEVLLLVLHTQAWLQNAQELVKGQGAQAIALLELDLSETSHVRCPGEQ